MAEAGAGDANGSRGEGDQETMPMVAVAKVIRRPVEWPIVLCLALL
jgi:hypothetical protein